MTTQRSGFTLIELMIVVAIVAIIAAIATPALMSSRMNGNETSAISSLRMFTSCTEQYRARTGNYPGALSDLENQGYIDDVLGAGSKSGYLFNFSSTATTWEINADPASVGRTGERFFYANDTGVIRFSTSGTASSASPPIN